LKDVSNGFIAEYGKLTVAQDDVLRKSIREAGAKYRVVKNTLPSAPRWARRLRMWPRL